MAISLIWIGVVATWLGGIALGMWLEARKWREKGDHAYMNRMVSGGQLYQVKRER